MAEQWFFSQRVYRPGPDVDQAPRPGFPSTWSSRLACSLLAALLVAAVLLLAACGSQPGTTAGTTKTATSAPKSAGKISEFPLPASGALPDGIATGPDGNLWFTECSSVLSLCAISKIGRITPSGQITEFPLQSAQSQPFGITAGPDGNLWFTELAGNQIGRITPSGQITEFPLSRPMPTYNNRPMGITAGPDGNLWFTECPTPNPTVCTDSMIGRITPSGQITTFPLPTAGGEPQAITVGPDGNLWFTEYLANQIGRITPSGQITEFPLPTANSYPGGISAGPDGNLWFTECPDLTSNGQCHNSQIERITPSGQVSGFALPTANSDAQGITAGPDGNLWFTDCTSYQLLNQCSTSQIGRITPSGQITEFPLPTANGTAFSITQGPDSNLWFTEYSASQIGRITP